jgi:CubicO group peptidase (beta-lactamase class C family)
VAGEIVEDEGDVTIPLPWASVTKLATALASLIAVGRGALSLDDPAGPPGATVRHLLAHASGLDFATTEVHAAPGHKRIYSNTGYEVLATTVSEAVGTPFGTWLNQTVLDPLGVTQTRLEGSPAAGLIGPLADLVGLVEELQRPRLLPEGAVEQLHTLTFPGLGGLLPGLGYRATNDWGLGAELRDGKSPHWTGTRNAPETFGHFGAAGGFVWVDPVAGVACGCLTSEPFGPWARAAWPRLSDAILADWAFPGGMSRRSANL